MVWNIDVIQNLSRMQAFVQANVEQKNISASVSLSLIPSGSRPENSAKTGWSSMQRSSLGVLLATSDTSWWLHCYRRSMRSPPPPHFANHPVTRAFPPNTRRHGTSCRGARHYILSCPVGPSLWLTPPHCSHNR